jgi:hypothetical protein
VAFNRTRFESRPVTPAPPLFIAHNSVKPILYYVITAEKVQEIGKLITAIHSDGKREAQYRNGWSTAFISSTIEIRKIPGVDVNKAVAIKTSEDNYYHRAVAQTKESYEAKYK